MKVSKTLLSAITAGILATGTFASCSKVIEDKETCTENCTNEKHEHVTNQFECVACGMG